MPAIPNPGSPLRRPSGSSGGHTTKRADRPALPSAPDRRVNTLPPAFGHLRLSVLDRGPSQTVVGIVVDSPPTLASSYFGGWATDRLVDGRAYIRYDGNEPLRQSFGLLLDGWRKQRNVDDDCFALEAMSVRAIGETMPPQVQLFGTAIATDRLWVVETLEPGPSLWSPDGHRLRQKYTVTLMEDRQPELTINIHAKGKAKTEATAKRRYVVKASDKSLTAIAARELGKASRWDQIAKLNPVKGGRIVHDPRSPALMKPGKVLRLP